MKIQYFKGRYPNFGDDLNVWMWPKLIPDFFDDNEDILFVGIGSILGQQPPGMKKIVFGAGFVPQYNDLPDVSGPEWDIYFVRGPRTAAALTLDPALAVGDAAILLRTLVDMKRKTAEVVSFMPHWESLERGNWEAVCRIAGITLIDPRLPVEEVIAQMLRSRLVIAEAMHGAIIADAFRIPWVPVLTIHPANREKWYDWAEALHIKLDRHRLWPSNLAEARVTVMHHPNMASVNKFVVSPPTIAKTKVIDSAWLGFKHVAKTLNDRWLAHLAAYRLKQLVKMSPQLSDDREMERVTALMLEKIHELKRDYADGPKR